MAETLYIVMPAYNEEENISEVVAEWYKVLEQGNDNSRIVIADGGSKDRTLETLYKLQKDYPKLDVLSYPETDHGTKVIILYKYAIEHKADWIFQTDTDGQTNPNEFEAFWNLRDRYDAIIGSRTKRGDGIGRKFVEDILRLYLLFYFGHMVPDANAPFRLMKSTLVKDYINIFPPTFNLPNAIMTECFVKYQDKVIFREITFKPRQGGKNYINVRRICNIGMGSFRNFSQIKKELKKRFPK